MAFVPTTQFFHCSEKAAIDKTSKVVICKIRRLAEFDPVIVLDPEHREKHRAESDSVDSSSSSPCTSCVYALKFPHLLNWGNYLLS